MTTEKKTAGDEVDSRCLKCKAVTNHIIVAMTGDTIAKVQCNSCGGSHNFRAPVAAKKKAAKTLRRRDGAVTESSSSTAKPKKTKAAAKKVVRGPDKFDALVKGKDTDATIPYSMDVTLAVGDLINHSVFALGLVIATISPNKAQVHFREHGEKVMICKLESPYK